MMNKRYNDMSSRVAVFQSRERAGYGAIGTCKDSLHVRKVYT